MLGPKGMAFDNDEILDDNDDEDLKSDPISQVDMQVGLSLLISIISFTLIRVYRLSSEPS
jgi:hypothetical protein